MYIHFAINTLFELFLRNYDMANLIQRKTEFTYKDLIELTTVVPYCVAVDSIIQLSHCNHKFSPPG